MGFLWAFQLVIQLESYVMSVPEYARNKTQQDRKIPWYPEPNPVRKPGNPRVIFKILLSFRMLYNECIYECFRRIYEHYVECHCAKWHWVLKSTILGLLEVIINFIQSYIQHNVAWMQHLIWSHGDPLILRVYFQWEPQANWYEILPTLTSS